MRKKTMQQRLAAQGLKFIVMAVFLLAVMGLMAGQGLAAVVDIGADGIFVEAGIDQATSLELRVAGPGGFHDLQQSNTGTLEWDLPAAVADGEYRYEVFILVGDEPEKAEDVEDNRELQYGNGRFVVEGGMISPLEDAPPAGSGQQSLIPSKSWLSRIVQMVGDFLVPSAHAADLTASSSSPTVWFDDTDVAGFEWHLRANYNNFYLYDGMNALYPFYVLDNSNFAVWLYDTQFRVYNYKDVGNSIYLDDDCGLNVLNADSLGDITLADGAVFIDKSGNNLGIGTITPSEDLHIVDSTPGILLDDTTDGDIKIEQGGGELWFQRLNDSTTESNGYILTLEDSFGGGYYPGVGIWTRDPDAPLHVGSHDNKSAKIIARNEVAPTAAGDVEMFALENTGNKIVRFKIQAGGGYSIWTFDNEPTYNGSSGFQSGRFRISKQGSGVAEFTVDGFGNGTFYGNSYATNHVNTSARAAKTDFQELNEEDILAKVMQLPVSQWRYKQEDKDARHIGPVAEDFQQVFGLGDGKTISTVDSEGIALAAIKAVKAEKDAEIIALKEDNRALLERLNALEELVRGRKVTQLMQ